MTDEIDPYEAEYVGKTLDGGRFVLGRMLGTPRRGLWTGEQRWPERRAIYVSFECPSLGLGGPSRFSDYSAQLMSYDVPGVAPLLFLGPDDKFFERGGVDPVDSRLAAVIEARPSGAALDLTTALTPPEVVRLGLGLCHVILFAEAQRRFIGGIRPSTVFVDGPSGKRWFSGMTPRALIAAGGGDQQVFPNEPYHPPGTSAIGYDPHCDVYAAALVLWYAHLHEHPYCLGDDAAANQWHAIEENMWHERRRPFGGPPELGRLLEAVLVTDVDARMKADELLFELEKLADAWGVERPPFPPPGLASEDRSPAEAQLGPSERAAEIVTTQERELVGQTLDGGRFCFEHLEAGLPRWGRWRGRQVDEDREVLIGFRELVLDERFERQLRYEVPGVAPLLFLGGPDAYLAGGGRGRGFVEQIAVIEARPPGQNLEEAPPLSPAEAVRVGIGLCDVVDLAEDRELTLYGIRPVTTFVDGPPGERYLSGIAPRWWHLLGCGDRATPFPKIPYRVDADRENLDVYCVARTLWYGLLGEDPYPPPDPRYYTSIVVRQGVSDESRRHFTGPPELGRLLEAVLVRKRDERMDVLDLSIELLELSEVWDVDLPPSLEDEGAE